MYNYQNIDLAFLIIIILIILIIIILFNSPNIISNSNNLTFKNIEYSPLTDDKDFLSLSQTPYLQHSGPTFTTEDDIISHSCTLSHYQALVVYGDIPIKYRYWGFTGYLHSYLSDNNIVMKSLGDSISCNNQYLSNDGTRLVIIMTSNQNMFKEIKFSLTKEFEKEKQKYLIVPLFIPQYLHYSRAKYTLLFKVSLYNSKDKIPQYKCRLYQTPSIKISTVPKIFLKNKNLYPKEKSLLSLEKWEKLSLEIVTSKGYKIHRKINLDNCLNLDCDNTSCNLYKNYYTENRDITRIISEIIHLEENQFLAIVAINHVISGCALYSDLSFYNVIDKCNEIGYLTHFTGDVNVKKINRDGKLISTLIINHPIQKNIRVIENVYVHPTNYIGPDKESLLEMQIFVVS